LDIISYNKIVDIYFNKTFQEFIGENQNQFDLVILFNVLHHSAIGEPKWVLNQVKNILTEKGLLLISFKHYKHSKEYADRQENSTTDIIKYLSINFKELVVQESEIERSLIYLGERYAPQ
jgi:2-polyprenyl-3-methyl-5-hydroxy-6-metoxy-1,4-benzoquinol methylase